MASSIDEKSRSEDQKDVKLNCKLLNEYIEYVREENAKLSSLLNDLGLGDVPEIEEQLKRLTFLQMSSGAKECSVEAITLAIAERRRDERSYEAHLKMCIKMYTRLNESLSKDIELTKSQINRSKEKIASQTPLPEDIKMLQSKIEKFETVLSKLENQSPLIKDPKLDLLNIMKQIETYNNLVEEKNKLTTELDVYSGLPPNITEAKQHLKEVKSRYELRMKM